MKKLKVFIDGSEGTTGLRIRERLGERDDVELIFPSSDALRKDRRERARLINSSDCVFLCLPDDASRESVSLCENNKTVIIDASTAHRTDDSWCYGFPELSSSLRESIASARRIAVPGCHAGGFISIAYPLVDSGTVMPDYPFSFFSLTGYSGGGKKMINSYESEKSDDMESPRLYALGQTHKHLNEIVHVCRLAQAPVFSPIVCDFYSGMLVTIPFYKRLAGKNINKKELTELLTERYINSENTGVVNITSFENDAEFNGFVASNKRRGLDGMTISVCGNDERITLHALYDNLGKGASGAAIQCMNIAFGINETKGLNL